jgi:double-stranded uracil-DNA glycosylase
MLPDVLKPGLRLVICGTAAGKRSAAKSQYYAGRGNQFWKVLYDVGLTGGQILTPADFGRLPEFGIGLTDLAKKVAGNDHEIAAADHNVEEFRNKLLTFEPKIIAFNGKKAASIFLSRSTLEIPYARQSERVGQSIVWVLPSTSAAARGHWRERPWTDLAKLAASAEPAAVDP